MITTYIEAVYHKGLDITKVEKLRHFNIVCLTYVRIYPYILCKYVLLVQIMSNIFSNYG